MVARKAKRRTSAGIVCPCCGSLLSEDMLQRIYELRRSQMGGRVAWMARKVTIPEGYVSLKEASKRMEIPEHTLRYRARKGMLKGFEKVDGMWVVPESLI